jgi:hypothetical protein
MHPNVPKENIATPEDIFRATGWQVGADGKWKYEIPDGKLVGDYKGTNKLGDIYDAPIFEYYPDLKDIEVTIDVRPDGAENSWYMPDSDSIEINVKKEFRVLQDLVHELQHAIQFREGFAIGGSYQTFIDNPQKFFNEEAEAKYRDLITEREMLRSLSFVIEYAVDEFPDMKFDDIMEAKFLKETFSDTLSDGVTPEDLSQYWKVEMNDWSKTQVRTSHKLNDMDEALGAVYELIEPVVDEITKESLHSKYERLAGEVEARNVTNRLGRVKTSILEKTEDTPREDQITIFEEEDTRFKQASIQDKVENISSIFDSQLELLDLYSSKEEVEINNNLDCG